MSLTSVVLNEIAKRLLTRAKLPKYLFPTSRIRDDFAVGKSPTVNRRSEDLV